VPGPRRPASPNLHRRDPGTASNASSAYIVDTSSVVVVLRQDATIEVDRSVKFSSEQVAVRPTLRADVVVPFPEAVVRVLGITPWDAG
jgi:hypothetical protein